MGMRKLVKRAASKARPSGGFLKRARADAARSRNTTGYQGSGGGGFMSMARRRRGGIGSLLSKVANRVNQQPEVVEQTQSYFNPATGMASEAAEYTAPNPVMDYIKQAQARGESPSQQGIQNFIGGLYQQQGQMGPIQASTPQGGFPQANYGGPNPPPYDEVQRKQSTLIQDRINALHGKQRSGFAVQQANDQAGMGMQDVNLQELKSPPMGMGGFGMQRPPMGMGGFGMQRPPMGMGGFGMQRPQQQYGNAYAYGQPQRPPMGMGGFGMQRPQQQYGNDGQPQRPRMQRPPMGRRGFGMQRPPQGSGRELPFGSFGGH